MAGTQPISIVVPIDVTDAMLLACNVAETDYPAFDMGATYADGDRVIVVASHSVYESLANANTGNQPASSPDKWIRVGATNAWKVFEESVSTQTVADAAGPPRTLYYKLKPGKAINAIGVLNVTGATSLQIKMTDATHGVVFDKTIAMAPVPLSPGWWQWLFGPRAAATRHIELALPTFPAADIEITLTGGDALACGVILLGISRQFTLGVQFGARLGITDYSKKAPNEWGDVVVVERPYSTRASVSMLMESHEVDAFMREMARHRARPVLWMLSTHYEALQLYGFYKGFEVLISYPTYADAEIQIEELT